MSRVEEMMCEMMVVFLNMIWFMLFLWKFVLDMNRIVLLFMGLISGFILVIDRGL